MVGTPEPGKYLDRAILLFLLGLLLFASPLRTWWSAPGHAWYLPYLLWLFLIVLALLLQRQRDRQ